MSLPNIPSDTIYKFSTVLGIFLISFTLFNWYKSLESKSTENKEIINNAIERAYLRNEIKELESKLDTFCNKKNYKYRSSRIKTNFFLPKQLLSKDSIYIDIYTLKVKYSKDTSLISQVNILNYKKMTHEQRRCEMVIDIKSAKFKAFNSKIIKLFSFMTIILGFLMTIWGFKTWYKNEFKQQKELKENIDEPTDIEIQI